VEVLQLAACAGGLDAAQLRMLKAQVTDAGGSPTSLYTRERWAEGLGDKGTDSGTRSRC
jgi:hypothetical protein